MKKIFKVSLGITGIALIACAGILAFNDIKEKKGFVFEQKAIPSTNNMIENALKGVEGLYISSAGKKDVAEAYKDVTADAVPHTFVEQIPEDFIVTDGIDKTLFMKIMTAHLLRTNEKILRERKVILLLEEKMNAQKEFTSQEKAFFDKMVKKYDVEHLNDDRAKILELIQRVDIIPVSLGVAVSIWATNWGQKNRKSPFFEHGWNKETKYVPIEFDDLSAATDSFALQLNTRSQLVLLRADRKRQRMFINKITFGQSLIVNMRNYLHFIPTFIDQLDLIYELGYIRELDNACFKEGCFLTK